MRSFVVSPPQAARLALTLSLASSVTKGTTPLARAHAAAELADKRSMIELGMATELYLPRKSTPTQPRDLPIDLAWEEMGLCRAVRMPAPKPRRLSLPLSTSRPKLFTFPALGDSIDKVLCPQSKTGLPRPEPSVNGRQLARWLTPR